jgi:hypothetical protein
MEEEKGLVEESLNLPLKKLKAHRHSPFQLFLDLHIFVPWCTRQDPYFFMQHLFFILCSVLCEYTRDYMPNFF